MCEPSLDVASSSSNIVGMMDDVKVPENSIKRVFQRYFPLLVILWILFVLYPNPANLVISIQRVFNLAVDPNAVESMVEGFPSAPKAIEKAVLEGIPYHYDWEIYDMPWYFPSVGEVLEKGEGDCKARALVLASIFEARGIPYQVNVSPIHVWVNYEGKGETSIENARVKFYQRDTETGERLFQFPKIELREVADSFWQSFWHPMPDGRKALLLSGLLALIAVRVVWCRKGTTE